MLLKNMKKTKKYKIGFYKRPQGVFTKEKISSIESELKNIDNIELFSNLDYREFYTLNSSVFFNDFNVSDLDLYFWHDTIRPLDWKGDNYYLNILKLLENNCTVINSSESVRIVNDKYLAHSLLKKNNLPVADFALVHVANKKALINAFNNLGKKVLIKPRFGGWGVGILKIESETQLLDTMELLLSFLPGDQQQVLLEKFYPNDISKWIAVVVFGNKVLFGYKKQIMEQSEWKVYDPDKKDGKGEYSEYVDPPKELKKIALQAKELINKDIVGFDFIYTEEGYKIVDENGRPGIYPQCLKGAGVNIEEETVNLILDKIN